MNRPMPSAASPIARRVRTDESSAERAGRDERERRRDRDDETDQDMADADTANGERPPDAPEPGPAA